MVEFFSSLLVAWLSPGRSLKLMPPSPKRRKYVAAYVAVGISMAVLPVVAWVLTNVLGSPSKLVFAMETLGLVAFTGYWVTKSLEMRDTQAELKALRGMLVPAR